MYCYRIHGHLTATYESGSTRQFLYGRTDTIRGASLEALDFCKAMLDSATTVWHPLVHITNNMCICIGY